MQQHSFLRGQTGEHLAFIPAMLCTPQVCQGLAGPWYARREHEAVKARVQ